MSGGQDGKVTNAPFEEPWLASQTNIDFSIPVHAFLNLTLRFLSVLFPFFQQVKVWDAQHCCVVAGINCGGNVHTLRMPSASTVGAAHCLVAVGSSSEDVALVDLRACSAAHRLQGHRPCSSYSSSHSSSSSSSTGGGDESGGVLSVDWSPRSEWVLASGGADGGVRLWDVRKSGAAACLACLDQYNVQGDDEDEDLDDSCSDWGKSRRNRRGGDIGGGRRGHGYGYSSNSSTEAHSNACAHGSAVVGLRFAPSGRHLVSLGTTGGASSGDDGGRPMKVWSVDNARVLPMHFSGVASQVRNQEGADMVVSSQLTRFRRLCWQNPEFILLYNLVFISCHRLRIHVMYSRLAQATWALLSQSPAAMRCTLMEIAVALAS